MLHDIVTFPPLFLFYLLDSPYLCPQNSNNALGGKCLTILTHDFMKTINGLLLVVITVLFGILCGCSQEDDGYDNADMYTLAEMGTRLGGKGDPGGTVKKKKVVFLHTNSNIYNPKGVLENSNPVLGGEYDTESLTISISNYNGNAEISILTVESGYLMSSTTVAVSSESSIDFSLLDYPTSAYYQIFVTLGSDTYYGVFDL